MNWLKVLFVLSIMNFFALLLYLPKAKVVRQQIGSETKLLIEKVTPTPVVKVIKKVITVTSSLSAEPTKVVAQPTVDQRCLVVVDGVSYDFSVFKNIHSGGDIFECGTDMSQTFHNEHPNSFIRKMAKYKI